MQAPPELIARHRPPAVWDVNRPAVELFLRSGTQWRLAGMDGIAVGLDYDGVRQVAALAGVALTPALFDDLQVMELAALSAWTEQRRRRLDASTGSGRGSR